VISDEQSYSSSIGSPAYVARLRGSVREELSQISDRALKAAKVCRSKARFWSRVYFIVGLPAAILAAVAGATALASPGLAVFAGSIALVSAGLTAAATFLDSATRQTSANNLAAGWQVLANDAHMKLIVDVDDDDWLVVHARDFLENLANRERKLLEGKAPDAEAEAEARAEIEKIRAQTVAARAEAMALLSEQARTPVEGTEETAAQATGLSEVDPPKDMRSQASNRLLILGHVGGSGRQ
jgi:hypothetical protein